MYVWFIFLEMNSKYYQTIFFLVAVSFTIYNVHNRFFTNKVKYTRILNLLIVIVNICFKTTVTYETRRLSEIEFPMYFSLVPDPGYNLSYLETCAIDGEWELFSGRRNKSPWIWGGNCSIEGTYLCLIRCKLSNICLKIFWMRPSWM